MPTERQIPRVRQIPWLGSPRAFLGNPGAFLLEAYREYGEIFRLDLFGTRMIAMLGPDANRMILASHRECFSHAIGYQQVTPLLGNGLLFQDGEEHRRNRRLMTPAFHQKGIQGYFDVMRDSAEAHLASWAQHGRESMSERFRRLTFEVMARLILGVRGNVDLQRLGELNDRLAKGAISFPRIALPFLPYGRGVDARRQLTIYLEKVIRERRSADPTDASEDDDALGLLMSARDDDDTMLSDRELADQAIILMFAGHETTMSMLTSTVAAVKHQPDVLSRLEDEQKQVVGDGPLLPSHIRSFPYLDAVLREVERLYPPISLALRGVVEDVEFRGHQIPAGSAVTYSCWATHRMPHVFREPERFDPERFLEPRSEHRKTPYGLVGFGGGARLCLGQAFSLMEMKIVLSTLLRGYDFELENPEPAVRYIPTAHPRCGLVGSVTPK